MFLNLNKETKNPKEEIPIAIELYKLSGNIATFRNPTANTYLVMGIVITEYIKQRFLHWPVTLAQMRHGFLSEPSSVL